MIAAHHNAHISFGFVSAIVCICFVWLGLSASAQDVLPKPSLEAVEGSLDGIQFIGPMGVEDEANPENDVFTFRDGKFVSDSCKKWGFSAAPYWVRRDANGIYFLAELESTDHGTMRYEGVFDGKEMRAVAYWKKERWYWTIERTYRFKGRPVKPAS